MKIVKIIYTDGSFFELPPVKPLEEYIPGDHKGNFKKRREYDRQFLKMDDEIIPNLCADNLEDYACNEFDLTKEDDVEEKQIEDFDDNEIMEEIRNRKLLGNYNNIISEQFLTRFSKIVEKENQMLLDSLLTEFEIKLNL